MFCTNCGHKAGDGERFCTNCGTPLEILNPANETTFAKTSPDKSEENVIENNQQTSSYINHYANAYTNQYSSPINCDTQLYPMKWFKFLIYFALFLSAIGGLIGGVSMFSCGNLMDELSSEMITSMRINPFEARRFVSDLGGYFTYYGLVSFGLAFLAIISRFALAGYKRSAVILINLYFIILTIAPAIYIYGIFSTFIEYIPAYERTAKSAAETACIIAVSVPTAINAVITIANFAYFKRRKSLFIR